MSAGKLPYLALYVKDWLGDPALRSCSLASRGLWVDMLCYMHDSPERGKLKLKKEVSVRTEIEQKKNCVDLLLKHSESLSRMVGGEKGEIHTCLIELFEAEVYSLDEDGSLISRRMIRDHKARKAKSDAGLKSVEVRKKNGNPMFQNLRTQDENTVLTGDQSLVQAIPININTNINTDITTTIPTTTTAKKAKAKKSELFVYDDTKLDYPFQSQSFKDKWRDWCEHRWNIGYPYTTAKAMQQAIDKLQHFDEGYALMLLETRTGEYRGLVFPDDIARYERSKGKPATRQTITELGSAIDKFLDKD